MEPRSTPEADPSPAQGAPTGAPPAFQLEAPASDAAAQASPAPAPASAPPADVAAPPSPPSAAPPPAAPPPAPSAPGGRLGAPARPVTWIRLAWFFYGMVALFALGFAIFSGNVWHLLGESAPTAAHLLAAVGLGCLIVVGCHLGVRFWTPFARASEAAARILGPLRLRDVVVLALLSGVAEELLFRGALWPTLGLAGTSLLFGLVHLLPKRDLWVYPLFALAAGLLLGLLRQQTESVVPAMVAHAVVNGLNLAWLSRIAVTLPATGSAGQPTGAPRA